MADGYVAVLESVDVAAKQVDNETVVFGAFTRYRQRIAIPDGADVTLGSTGDAANAATLFGQMKGANAKLGGTLATDVSDRIGRLLGHVTVDNASIAVTGPLTDAQLRASAVPVSVATQTDDVGITTKASESAGTRLAVTAALRLLDTTQTAGSQLVAAPGDGTLGQWVNVKSMAALPTGSNTIGKLDQGVAGASAWVMNMTQLGGTAIDTNSGLKSAGTQRVVLATDQPALTNALKVDGSAVTQPISGTVTSNQGGAPWSIGGNVASLGADAGNPVKIGGVYSSTLPTATNGQRVDLQVGTRGSLNTTLFNQDGTVAAAIGVTNTDGQGNSNGLVAHARNALWNTASWDLLRGSVNATTGDTGTKVATFAGATQTNFNHRGAYITILLGTVSGTTPTLSCQLQWSPDGGTTWLNIGAALANLTASSQTGTIWIYPTNSSTAGATPAALTTGATNTLMLNGALPRTWRLNYTIGGTTPSFAITSVNVNYIL